MSVAVLGFTVITAVVFTTEELQLSCVALATSWGQQQCMLAGVSRAALVLNMLLHNVQRGGWKRLYGGSQCSKLEAGGAE
jgi:hypothetical protein